MDHNLPDTLLQAIDFVATRGTAVPSLRVQAMHDVWNIATDQALVQATRYALDRWAPSHIRCGMNSATQHIAFVAACTIGLSLSNTDLAVTMCCGQPVLDVAPTGNWRPIPREPTSAWSPQANQEWRASLFAQTRNRDTTDMDRVLWDLALEELDAYVMDGPFDWEMIHAIMGDDFIVHRRFGVDQEDKIRLVDDATESGLNAIIRLGEKLALIKPDWPARVTAAFLERLPLAEIGVLLTSTDDIAKAYRRFFTSHPRYSVIILKHPDTGEPAFFTMPGFPFGTVSAVRDGSHSAARPSHTENVHTEPTQTTHAHRSTASTPCPSLPHACATSCSVPRATITTTTYRRLSPLTHTAHPCYQTRRPTVWTRRRANLTRWPAYRRAQLSGASGS
jgi:hypothetical protein